MLVAILALRGGSCPLTAASVDSLGDGITRRIDPSLGNFPPNSIPNQCIPQLR